MSFQYKLTDEEMYYLICGMHAGLKLKDLTLPAIDTSLVLHPIGVGGEQTIGLNLPIITYDGVNRQVSIPVSVHDVNIDYSGFSVNIKWDSSRLRFTGVEQGDFGSISDGTSNTDIRYTYSNGVFKARGIRDSNVKFDKPIILFYIKATIVGDVYSDDPILLNFVDKSFSNLDYCTLLTWVEVAAGQWYNFFITPLVNVSGKIVSDIDKEGNKEDKDEEDKKKESIGEEKDITAGASPSGVYIGEAYTVPGERGVVPVYVNSSTSSDFPFNKIHCRIVVNDDESLFSYLEVVGTGGFSVETTKSTNDNGQLVLDIMASRTESKTGSQTFCYIDYSIKEYDYSYRIPLINALSELISGESKIVVDNENGFIKYSTSNDEDNSGGNGYGGGSRYDNGGGKGGFGGSGSMWSSCEQVIWISAGGLRYPIYLKAGWNEVKFYIPNIFPEDTWVETTIIIESTGYLLIPAGFSWFFETGEDAPKAPANSKMTDKLKFTDCYDVEIFTPAIPIDADDIIDSIEFGDISLTEIETIAIKVFGQLEELGIEDIHDLDLIVNIPETDVVITESEVVLSEPVVLQDTVTTELINVTITDNQSGIDAAGFEDIYDIDFKEDTL